MEAQVLVEFREAPKNRGGYQQFSSLTEDVEESSTTPSSSSRCCNGCCAACRRPFESFWNCVQAACQDGEDPLHGRPATRSVLYDCGEVVHRDDKGGRISPYSQDLVIVNRQLFPEPIFRRIRFTQPNVYNRLVTEVEYGRRTADIYYDVDARDDLDQDGYGRLVTLNWWYQQLCVSLLLATLSIASTFSNFVFCINLFTETNIKVVVPFLTRCVYAVLFVIAELALLNKCRLEVNKEWRLKADPERTGDLIISRGVNGMDQAAAWVALFFFKFVHLDAIVKDIIIWLHPWKNVQPYAAFKADGARCYMIGWASEYMYRCDNKQGQQELLSMQLFLVGIVCTFKINVIIESGCWAQFVLAVAPLVNFFVIMVKHWNLLSDRRRHWEWLRTQRQHSHAGQDLERVIVKQKSVHFTDIGWEGTLNERLWFVVNTTAAILISVLLGVVMHIYDFKAEAKG